MNEADAEIEREALKASADWHGAWALAFALVAALWPGAGATPLGLALAAAAAPGLIGQLLRVRRGWPARVLVGLGWPLGAGVAIVLSGGLSGPLAALALAPAAAMATLDGRRFVALGAALTAVAIIAIALMANAGLTWPVPVAAGPWLPPVTVSLAAIGLAAALQLSKSRGAGHEATRAKEAARLKQLLDTGPFLLLRLDAEGVIRETFCGAPEDADLKLMGRAFDTLACDADRAAARIAREITLRQGQASVGFAPPLAPDRFLTVELRGLPHGEMLALVRDASRERAYEAYLDQARADAEAVALAKSRFLANMSHELRTPLNAIIGFSDIMRAQLFGPLAPRYQEYAGLIHESGGHLLDLINDVLDMSKIEAERFTLTLEPFDAREAVSAALRLTRVQADQAKIALRGALASTPLEVNADRRALKQIVLNLVSNALKFTPAGGQVNVVARARGRDLEIIVADTGVGIAPADVERLGRPYEQAGGAEQRALGTGLGLSLVRAFAELHGGTMTIKSVLGEGTAVSVRLPVIDLEQQAPSSPPPEPPPHPRRFAGDNVIAFTPR